MNAFELHPRLAEDCLILGRFALCRVLLMNESRYPWLILVPERANITEIHHLKMDDQYALIRESSLIASRLEEVFQPDKLNIAAIGNLVPQLHVHHVVRYRDDAAWPAPIWGRATPIPYDVDALSQLRAKLSLETLAGFQLYSDF